MSKSEKTIEPTFDKKKLVNSKRYINNQDALNAILEENKKYTIEQADKLLEKFMKGKVM